MLNVNEINRYFVRTTKLAEYPSMTGQVMYLRHVAQDGIIVSPTDDCRPLSQLIPLSAAANDSGWYDATELVLDANCAITPRYDMCAFVNETAKDYRNHIRGTDVIRRCDGKSATGRLCFIGEERDGGIAFSSTAYFVVSLDENNYYIAYSGFCEPKKGNTKRVLTQRVLRLTGSNRNFYEAAPIVSACNKAYEEDVVLCDKYVKEIKERVSISASDMLQSSGVALDRGKLSGLDLYKNGK